MTMHVYELRNYKNKFHFHYAWFVWNTAYSIHQYWENDAFIQILILCEVSVVTTMLHYLCLHRH